jgi:hypothetical protein
MCKLIWNSDVRYEIPNVSLFSRRSERPFPFSFFLYSHPICLEHPSFRCLILGTINQVAVMPIFQYIFCRNVTTLLTTHIRIQPHSSSCGISGGHSELAQVFLKALCFPIPFSILPVFHSRLSSRLGTIGPLEYVVRSDSVSPYSYD